MRFAGLRARPWKPANAMIFDKDDLIDFPEYVQHFVVEGAFPVPAGA